MNPTHTLHRLAMPLVLIALILGLATPSQARQSKPKSRVLCYTSYDSEYFYFAAVVNKPNLAGTQNLPFSRPKEDDAVAVYLQSEATPAGPKRTAKSVEMVASVAGGVQLYRGANATPLASFADFLKTPGENGRPVPFKFGIKRSGNLNGSTAETNSYTVEMAVPWVELGEPPTVGQRMRFNVVAFSAAPSTPHILSLSPRVKTAEDVENPSLWGEIVFVDAPVRSVASAPDAKVSARLYTAKPLIDGDLEEGPWNTLTAFGFAEAVGGGAEAIAPTAGLARIRPKVSLKSARPAIAPTGSNGTPLPEVKPHQAQSLPKLLFTLYQYDFQNDARKQAPYRPVQSPEGVTRLSDHPLSGTGPWMTYDRVDWHRGQLDEARRAGIDVVLPIYRGSAQDKQRNAIRGLMTLAAALKQMHADGQDYPLVGMYLDTTSLADAKGEKLDLKTGYGQDRLYAAIKDFYLTIPARFRAAIPLSERNGGGDANVVVLSSAAAFADIGDESIAHCRARFRQDFGADLLVLGAPDFKGKANLDGYVADTHGRGFQMDEGGWIKPAAVGPGYDPASPTSDPKLTRRREEGETYRKDWKQALAKQPTWVFMDGWNDFEDGAEIAPTLQHGVEYVDLTRVFGFALKSGGTALRASYLSHSVPPTALAGGTSNVSVRVTNAGAGIWTTDAYSLVYQWKKSGGTATEPVRVPLPQNVPSTLSVTVPVALKLPADPGAYSLVVDVAQIGRKGDITALLSGLGSPKLEVPVRVAKAGDAALPAYAVTVVSNDLTITAEAGGSYAARVTLRNDGAETWKKSQSSRILARVWRYTSPINGTGEQEALEPVDMADAGASLPADVPPGGLVSLTVPVTFSTAEDSPLRAWSQADNWSYQLRWEYSADENGAAGAVSSPEPLALVDADFGVQFTTDGTLGELGGDRRLPVKLGLRNMGPQTWAKGAVRVGYHWYYLDGTEAVWQDETTPLPQEIEPGGEVSEMLAWVGTPAYDGTYWLVWDVKVGDSWTSTMPSVRSGETLVRKVEIVNGRLYMPDLAASYNLDGVAGDANRADGGFDSSGRTFPAELIPPYATIADAPVGMWLPVRGSGGDTNRNISFHWGPKGDKDRNFIECVGQKVPLGDRKKAQPAKLVHLLAASTKADVIGSFLLLFEDGSEQLVSLPLSRWDAQPTHGEEIAYFCRYSRTRTGEDLQKPVGLFHYVLKVAEKSKKLVAIQMPAAPDIKVAAITVEK